MTSSRSLPLLPVLLLACGARAAAQTQILAFPLETGQAVPPLATGASGSAMLSLDPPTGIVTVLASYQGLSGTPTEAHLHGPAVAGQVAPSFAPLSVTGGASGTISGLAFLSQARVAQILAGEVYLDLHSSAHPEGELRGQVCRLASALSRNAGANPSSYTCSAPVLGGSFSATVDLSTTGHAFALLFGFVTPVDLPLGGGQRLLCLDLAGGGEVFTGTGLGPRAGPLATFVLPTPSSLAFCNVTFSSQALHFAGVTPFALSNARDLSFGF